jgi:hypothetical protein
LPRPGNDCPARGSCCGASANRYGLLRSSWPAPFWNGLAPRRAQAREIPRFRFHRAQGIGLRKNAAEVKAHFQACGFCTCQLRFGLMREYRAAPPGRAGDLFRRIEKLWKDCYAGKPADREVQLLVATPFGVHRVTYLHSYGPDTLMISTHGAPDDGGILCVPVEQCSFMIRHYKPEPEEERVIVGFGTELRTK